MGLLSLRVLENSIIIGPSSSVKIISEKMAFYVRIYRMPSMGLAPQLFS